MRILLLALLVALSACATTSRLKPTVFTVPTSYIDSFPLEKVSEAELLAKVGLPSETIEIDGKKAFVYEFGNKNSLLNRTFTYTFDGDVVIDVIFNDSGPYNGLSARKRQRK